MAALQLISKNPEVMAKLENGLFRLISGGRGGADDDPSWNKIIFRAVENGQAAASIQAVMGMLMQGLAGLIGTPAPQGLPPAPPNNVIPMPQAAPPPQQNPADLALLQLLNHAVQYCARHITPEDTAQEIFDAVYEEVPALYRRQVEAEITRVAGLPVDAVMAYVGSLEGGAQVAGLPHARQWVEQLQEVVKATLAEEAEGEDA
jgi:hypothetical protein